MSKDFIDSSHNDEFVKLRGLDLQDLLVQVENYYLEYRKSLDLPNNLTFGIEIEYESLRKRSVDKFLNKESLTNWKSKDDGSLKTGGEITSPVMRDYQYNWLALEQVCDFLSSKKANTKLNAGGHVHIGANILGEDIDAWRQFVKLYTAYESILLRFVYGDKMSGRRRLYKYARPISDMLNGLIDVLNTADCMYDLNSILSNEDRYIAVNFKNVDFYEIYDSYHKNTIEFRSPNATTNKVIWQNNINAFSKMLLAARDGVMDEDFLDYKLKKEFISYNKNKAMYDFINIKYLLEFVDLVFDNNLDKIYFIRQYLKNFENGYGVTIAAPSKKFVTERVLK